MISIWYRGNFHIHSLIVISLLFVSVPMDASSFFPVRKHSKIVHGTSKEIGKDTVKVGAYILSIYDINFHDREYSIRYWVWMRYKNPLLHFERYIEVPDAKTVEKPDTINQIQTDSAHQQRFGKDDSILVTLKMKCLMKENWDVDRYPFDRETLRVRTENTYWDTSSMVFQKDSSGIRSDTLPLLGWNPPTISDTVEFHHYKTSFGDITVPDSSSTYSAYVLQIILTRDYMKLFFKLYLGMYVAFFIAFIGFFINPEHVDSRFEIPIGGVFAVIGNKYIIEPLLPEGGSTITLVDKLHVTTLIFIMVMIAVSALIVYLNRKAGKKEVKILNRNFKYARFLDGCAAALLFGSYIIINWCFIANAYHHGL